MYPYFEKKARRIFLSHYCESYNFPSHFHSYFEITCCLDGIQKVKIGEKIYTLKKGDVIAIFPGNVHEYIRCNENTKTEVVSIICDTGLLSVSCPDIVTKTCENPFIESASVSEDTHLGFRKILSSDSEISLIGWTHIILSDALKSLHLTKAKSHQGLPERIISYIESEFREPLTINHIAKVFGYHPSYIAHLFSDTLKIPFRTFLGAVRCENAALHIKNGEKSLTEIAYESGFNSLNTFCRCFKKHFNMTPSEYKKQAEPAPTSRT